MSSTYGIESHPAHHGGAGRPPARYLVLIDSDGARVAKLYDAERHLVNEVDAGVEEVGVMLRGLAPTGDGSAGDWDRALSGHDVAARRAAEVYELTP